MKIIFVVVCLLLLTEKSFALNYEINHPCSKEQSAKGQMQLEKDTDALSITVAITKIHQIKVDDADNGIRGFYNLPGTKNFEILSNTTYRAYGWCYQVNGQFPDLMPNDYILKDSDNLVWHLGSSTFSGEKWIDYCTPVTNLNTFICEQ